METNYVRTSPLNLSNFPIWKYPVECGGVLDMKQIVWEVFFLMSVEYFSLNFISSVLYTVYILSLLNKKIFPDKDIFSESTS